jgi:colicin import membrane protein
MTQQPFRIFRKLLASLLVAMQALFHCASAQNLATNQASTLETQESNELAERERIAQLRNRSTQDYEAAKVACYQKLVVNACLNQARDQHNRQQADLKRQEIGLNDQQRKRRSAQQLERTEAQTSPERAEETARKRGQALQDGANREQRAAQRLSASTEGKRTAAQAADATKAPSAQSSDQMAKQKRAQANAQKRQQKLQKAAQTKAQFDQRQDDAAQRKSRALKRQENNTKPPAPLPKPVAPVAPAAAASAAR